MGHFVRFKLSGCMQRPEFEPNEAIKEITSEDIEGFYERLLQVLRCNLQIWKVLMLHPPVTLAFVITAITFRILGREPIVFLIIFLIYKIILFGGIYFHRQDRKAKVQRFLEEENKEYWKKWDLAWTYEYRCCRGEYLSLGPNINDNTVSLQEAPTDMPSDDVSAPLNP